MKEAIKVKNLVKKYNNFTAVLDISFDVREGEVFGFLGPNGAGKTTTISILTTLKTPTSGSVKVSGFEISSQKSQVRSSIGLIFQEPTLDEDLTAWDNLKFHAALYHVPAETFEKRAKELLTMVELWDRKDDLVKNYSGGMKRRLEIARGLLHHPKILFMDEPTLGLDPQTRSKIWDYVLNLHKRGKITLFMTTHYMDEAEYCDRIAIIDHGEIIALDTPANLKKKTGAKTVNNVFLELTGRDIRDEGPNQHDKLKNAMRRGPHR